MHRTLGVVYLGVFCLLILVASTAGAQPESAAQSWTFRTRAVMTGVSDSSDPEGYKVYSGIGMEWSFGRAIGRHLAVSWNVGAHSREVDFRRADGSNRVNLGSIEVLPVDVMLQYHLRPGGRFHPYAGVGVGASLFWEKSGALDSTDLTPGFGPVAEIGFDYDISSRMVFNVDVRLARLKTDLEADGTRIATLALHPTTLGAGIGFRF